jgi:adenosine deaminase
VFDPDGNFLGMHTETTASYGTAAKSAEIVDKLKAWQIPTTNITDIPVADRTVSAAARRFESIRNDPTMLMQFLRAMPKGGDLHSHLSGAVPAEKYTQFAMEAGLCVARDTWTLASPPCDSCEQFSPRPSVRCAQQDPFLYNSLVDAWSLRSWRPEKESGHDHFYATFSKFGPALKDHVGDALASIAHQAASDHLVYVELMHTLDGSQSAMLGAKVGWSTKVEWESDPQQLREELTEAGLRDIITETRRTLDRDEAKMRLVLRCGSPQADPGCDVTIRYIYQGLRGLPPEQVFAQMLTGFELSQADPRVVGFTLAMPEDFPVPMRDFALHMRMLSYLHHLYPKVHLSLHAGELATGLVSPDGMRSHVRESVYGGAERIGHGTDIAYEDESSALLKELVNRDVLVEICLTSDDVILGVRGAEHPLQLYLRSGVPVTLATNDSGILRTDMSQEYRRAAETYKLTYADLKQFARQSLEHAFLAGNRLWRNNKLNEVVDECAADLPGTSSPSSSCTRFLQSSEKARVQWKLEEQFAQFESQF